MNIFLFYTNSLFQIQMLYVNVLVYITKETHQRNESIISIAIACHKKFIFVCAAFVIRPTVILLTVYILVLNTNTVHFKQT